MEFSFMRTDTDKVYYEIDVHSSISNVKARSLVMFLSKHWTVGRCLDSVCRFADVENRNNEKGACRVALAFQNSALPNDLKWEIITSEIPSGSTLGLLQLPA